MHKTLDGIVIPECFNRKSIFWIPAFAGMTGDN